MIQPAHAVIKRDASQPSPPALPEPRGWTGLRCIGDVHGESGALAQALEEAWRQKRFVVQLGDLIDRGLDSPGALDLMLTVLGARRGLFIRSNHDDRLFRHLQGHAVKITAEGLGLTLDQIEKRPDAERLMARFAAAYAGLPYWWRWGHFLFVHGAFHPAMLDHARLEEVPRLRRSRLRALALYGETDGTRTPEGYPNRTYNWIDRIPEGIVVVVGHDVRCHDLPLQVTGVLGGRAVFTDLGAGKGGRLAWVDIDLRPDGSGAIITPVTRTATGTAFTADP